MSEKDTILATAELQAEVERLRRCAQEESSRADEMRQAMRKAGIVLQYIGSELRCVPTSEEWAKLEWDRLEAELAATRASYASLLELNHQCDQQSDAYAAEAEQLRAELAKSREEQFPAMFAAMSEAIAERDQLRIAANMVLLFCEDTGEPVDGFRFREEALKLWKLAEHDAFMRKLLPDR